MSTPYPSTSRGWSPLRVIGIVLALASLVIGIYATVRIVTILGQPLAETLTAPSRQAPFDEFMSLREGRYTVFESVGPVGDAGAPTTVRPGRVTVAGPTGKLEVSAPSLDESIDLGTEHFVAVATFTTATAGQHRVAVRGGQATIKVGPSLGSGIGDAGGWLLTVAASALGFLVGLGMLLASFLRRRPQVAAPGFVSSPAVSPPAVPPSANPPPTATPPTATPPGWYDDPQGVPQQVRYWDGTAWTSHVQPRG